MAFQWGFCPALVARTGWPVCSRLHFNDNEAIILRTCTVPSTPPWPMHMQPHVYASGSSPGLSGQLGGRGHLVRLGGATSLNFWIWDVEWAVSLVHCLLCSLKHPPRSPAPPGDQALGVPRGGERRRLPRCWGSSPHLTPLLSHTAHSLSAM